MLMEENESLRIDGLKYVRVRITEEVQETTERWAERIVRGNRSQATNTDSKSIRRLI
jgi:hypothetical protein